MPKNLLEQSDYVRGEKQFEDNIVVDEEDLGDDRMNERDDSNDPRTIDLVM
ncbi:hypothetical protein RchiOBHm_Chr1g0325761 [Rosa chinensis]|uniref:Uncharacterized protein n=1 Tax=Rosa chinensis TaxID=74649 RepID=A0A2P6SA40_ROSCH|nr:hypothetical protein RchiOBHm_Chr1g0325761 [Rosa chinensis]